MEDETLPVVVDDESKLPEGLSNYYKQNDDGTYVLNAQGVDSHPDVKNLRTSLERQKKDREKIRQERDKFSQRAQLLPDDLPEDIDADTIRQAVAAQAKQKPGQADQDASAGNGHDAEQYRQQMERRHQKQMEERDRQIQEKDKELQRLQQERKGTVVDQALSGALGKHIKGPGRLNGAKRLLADKVQITEGEDGTLQPVVETGMGEVSVEKYVTDWLSSDEGADFLEPSAGSGARGAQPGQGPKGPKQVRRSQFDAMTAEQRRDFALNGGQITDG